MSNTEVKLPDGTTIHAPNAQAANAVRAALNGAPSDAYQQAGVTLPPPGTPVLSPVGPGDLQAGDVGVWKNHQIIALGNDKVLISGQVQPESSVGSSPDFLGWMRPTQTGSCARPGRGGPGRGRACHRPGSGDCGPDTRGGRATPGIRSRSAVASVGSCAGSGDHRRLCPTVSTVSVRQVF